MTADLGSATLAPLAFAINGRTLRFDVDARRAERAWVALGVRKSGSSVFSSMVEALATANGVTTLDVPGKLFDAGVRYLEWNSHPRITDLLWRGNAYIGFRDPPTAFYDDPVFQEAAKILLVRDPRDALVSEYFSNAYSHSLPAERTGGTVVEQERGRALESDLDTYVLDRADHLDRTVAGYRHLISDPNLLILRYEDVIFDKAGWIARIARHFGWRADEQLVSAMLGWADVRPETEDPHAFIRRVTPGDHARLSPETIVALTGRLSDVWREFGYVLD